MTSATAVGHWLELETKEDEDEEEETGAFGELLEETGEGVEGFGLLETEGRGVTELVEE